MVNGDKRQRWNLDASHCLFAFEWLTTRLWLSIWARDGLQGDGVLGSSTAKAHVACFGSFVVPNGTKYSCFLVRLQSGAISTAKWLTDMNGEVLVLHHRDVMNANKVVARSWSKRDAKLVDGCGDERT